MVWKGNKDNVLRHLPKQQNKRKKEWLDEQFQNKRASMQASEHTNYNKCLRSYA